MPPWVARQWHAWGCLRSVSGDLCHSQRFRGPITLRSYAQSSSQSGAKIQLRTANSAVIIPSSVGNTLPEDLITHIKPVLRKRVTEDRFAVFFVTPAFATWLLDDTVFLQKALRQAYKHILDRNESPYAVQIHALCAVVDKLPISRPIGSIDHIEEEGLQRIEDPAIQETGHEGIAYATLRSSDSIPTPSDAAQDKASISFVGFERSNEEGEHFSDSVRLPVANTVFQTGSPTTMTYSTWEKAKGSQVLTLKEKRNISHHGIRMQLDSDTQPTALSVPLVPLSKPREVVASMGNILRRVKGPDGATITASQELEQLLPSYFGARGEPSQATTVWALVMDHDHVMEAQNGTDLLLERASSDGHQNKTEDKSWENMWKQDPPPWSPLVSTALRSGARLHRVLSGGGGWGKKAGLLSLDPIPTVETDTADELSTFDAIDGPGDLGSALQQVAQEGDYVQFFMSPSVPEEDVVTAGSSPDKAVWGLELGTIPSTTDSMPAAPGQAETAGTNEISVFRYTFGALAEGGMILSRSSKLKPGDSFSTVGRTTVDVPFSRFSAVKWRTESSLGEDEDVDSFRSLLESKTFSYRRDLVKSLYGEAAPAFLGLGLGLDSSKKEVIQKPGNSISHISREDEDLGFFTELLTAPQVPSIQPMAQVARIATPPKSQQSAAIASAERNTLIDNDHYESALELEQITKALVPEQPPIRFYNINTPRGDKLIYYISGLHRVRREVARYTKKYRELMYQIRRQNGLRRDFTPRELKPKRKSLFSTSNTPVRMILSDAYENEAMRAIRLKEDMPVLIRKVDTGAPRGLIPWLESASEESAHWVRTYQGDFDKAMARIRMDGIYRFGLSSTILAPINLSQGGHSSNSTGALRLTNVRLTPRRLLTGLSNAVHQTQLNIDDLQERIHLALQTFVVERRANSISDTVATFRKIISDALTIISFRAHMALDTNNSAVDVYTLHIHLRRALTTMTMSRRGRGSVALLRNKLIQLRAFRENLFTGRKNRLIRDIHGRLQVMETRHHLSKKNMIRERNLMPADKRKVDPWMKRKVYPLKITKVNASISKEGSGRLAVMRKMRPTRVRKINREYSAVRNLEELVRGWVG
ncbi:uncharacterized protein N0V89_006985 [Didymosphaeria variabile]|uniref:Uncharacterized protein n=1 Tax=Didymosphaeria variabile TaxID=1932322 RepID=A0A9W9CA19_9PLEO|nr:uncharacterized protein N0V89_006985 [Didymosphaeria variabile]KAJ4351642.1 hypothetical protein N0V89_006985 [Didymosphaeria variabile]